MAELNSSIFNKRAAEKLRSPDDLDKYLRVTNPSVWIVLGACMALLAGLLVWGIFGTVATSVNAKGTVESANSYVALVTPEDATRIHEGDRATVDGKKATVASIGNIPVSQIEAYQVLQSDYLTESLMPGSWAYVVTLKAEEPIVTPSLAVAEVVITTERVSPLSLILGRTQPGLVLALAA